MMLNATTTQTTGFKLEAQVLRTLTLNHINVLKADWRDDRYHAQDFLVEGLPVQITIQKWDNDLATAHLVSKIKWTEQQSDNKAIVVAFDKSATVSQWPSMILLMARAIKAMAKKGIRTHVRISPEKMEILCESGWKEVAIR